MSSASEFGGDTGGAPAPDGAEQARAGNEEVVDAEEEFGDDDLDSAAAEEIAEPYVAVSFEEAVEAPVAGGEGSSLERERDEYLDTLRRVQAEFDNYRKRVARQQLESMERATESLLERLLPVLDALDLALAHGAVNGDEPTADRQALQQIASLLRDTLGKEGLERIDAADVEFDPKIHDAVAHVEEGEHHGAAVVAEVLRPGYQLKGKVVRPAMVQVRG